MQLSFMLSEILPAREAAGCETWRCFWVDSLLRDMAVASTEFFVLELLTVQFAVTIDLFSRAVLPLLGSDWKLWCLFLFVLVCCCPWLAMIRATSKYFDDLNFLTMFCSLDR